MESMLNEVERASEGRILSLCETIDSISQIIGIEYDITALRIKKNAGCHITRSINRVLPRKTNY